MRTIQWDPEKGWLLSEDPEGVLEEFISHLGWLSQPETISEWLAQEDQDHLHVPGGFAYAYVVGSQERSYFPDQMQGMQKPWCIEIWWPGQDFQDMRWMYIEGQELQVLVRQAYQLWLARS